jgi:aspartokinase/homoserine dehydrogenase 1
MGRNRLIVMKFGGTSVGNAERFRQCAAIVAQAAKQDRIIVVVSAMAGVTDLIFKTIEAARHGDSVETKINLQKFESVHRELIRGLFDQTHHAAASNFTAEVISQLQSACDALSALRSDISAQTSDSLVAFGERISSWALAQYLQQTGNLAEFVRAEKVIVTDSNFGNAAPDIEATRNNASRRCCRFWNAALYQSLQAIAAPMHKETQLLWVEGDQITRQPSSERRRTQMKFGFGLT